MWRSNCFYFKYLTEYINTRTLCGQKSEILVLNMVVTLIFVLKD